MGIPLPRAAALLVVAMMTGCGEAPRAPAQPAKAEEAKPDHVTRTTVRAMCGQAKDRALAISQIAEEDEFNGESDDVYSIASDLAEKGCPKVGR
ncbi:hypothetical protein [Sphingomonas faeni]|uniref:hypothetical protein n=1 Tax=Sphingomonas faeni TaxID=185950 RepID=UPI0033584176